MALLTTECPTTIPMLLNVKGIGKVKGEQYGKDIVDICNSHTPPSTTPPSATPPSNTPPSTTPPSATKPTKTPLFDCLRNVL